MLGPRLFAFFTGLSTVAPSESEHVAAVAAAEGEARACRSESVAR
jgi:hypothetical protein